MSFPSSHNKNLLNNMPTQRENRDTVSKIWLEEIKPR